MVNRIDVGVITNADGAHLTQYFSALAESPEVAGVAVADPSGKSIEPARARLGDRLRGIYEDAASMLREAKPAMALVSIEPALAPPLIDAALEAGCHVLSEKPGCVRADDFAKLVRKADAKHLYLMLALANRPHSPVQRARQLFQAGTLGKLYGMDMHLVADQTRLTRADYRNSWRCVKARGGGGHLIWLGIHWIDLALYITGLEIRRVAGFAGVVGGQPIDVEDSAALALEFSNGAFGTMSSGFYLDKGYHSYLKLWGEHGWLQLSTFEDEPLRWYTTKDEPNPTVQVYRYSHEERSYGPFVRSAVRASAGLQDPPITGAECLHVLRAIFAFYEAARTGKSQTVEPRR